MARRKVAVNQDLTHSGRGFRSTAASLPHGDQGQPLRDDAEKTGGMNGRVVQPRRDSVLLSQSLKLIRRHRRMTAADVARAMATPLRTYERFEAGEGRLNIDYIHRFAAATDSDPYAILMAVAIGSPELARRCADNKLVTTLTIGAQRFDRALGDRIQGLEARTVIDAVCTLYDDLAGECGDQLRAARWLEAGMSDLSATRPRPGR